MKRSLLPALLLGAAVGGPAYGEPPVADRFMTGTIPWSKSRLNLSEGARHPRDRAVARFDRLEACGKTEVDGFTFRKARFWTPEEFEVCLFLLAERLGTVADMKEWFESQAFETVFSAYRWQGADTQAGNLQASVLVGFADYPFNTVFDYLLAGTVFGRSLGISVLYDEAGVPGMTQLIVFWL